ncbi:MAG: outer membrane beta-barrel protein [Chitinophagaceae bacterium]
MNKIRIRLLAVCVSFVLSSGLKAQFEAASNDHDDLPYYFGLTFGYNNSFLHTVRDPGFYDGYFKHVEPKGGGGIELGLMATLKLREHWEVRTVPKLIIGGAKSLTYYFKDGVYANYGDPAANYVATEIFSENIKLPQTLVSVPVHIKFSSDRIGNLRAYIFGGPKYDFNLSANSEEYTKDRTIIAGLGSYPAPQFRKGSLGAELGLGVHVYLRFATISPEIRMGTSLQNDHLRDADNPYSSVFNKIQQRMLSFSINIEQ